MTFDNYYRSYKNHLVYSVLYGGILALAIPKKETNNTANTTTVVSVLRYGVAGLAALALQSEVRYAIRRRRMPPGDSGSPVVGHFLKTTGNPEQFYKGYILKYGPICTLNLFMTPCVVVTNEEDVRWAMSMERKGPLRALMLPHFRKLIGEEAIMFKSGEEHRCMRKVFEPAFTPGAIRDYAAVMDQTTKEQLKTWHSSGTFQQPREWALLAMKIFFVCAFGEVDEGRLSKIGDLFEGWIAGTLAPIPFNIPGTTLAKGLKFKRALSVELQNLIDEFKAQYPPDSPNAKTSVLGRLCYAVDENGNNPTDEQVLDNLRFFVFAGFDTTKGSFGGIAHFLKENPYAEETLVQEIQSFGSPDNPLDIDQLKNDAPVLNAILAETWRLSAPLASHAMNATQDIEYKGYLIPKGSFVATDTQAHNIMNNSLYPKAAEFHFERWLPKDHPLYDPKLANTEVIDYNVMNSKFRSFNYGPHMCLGAHFAKQEVRIVVVRLLQGYCFEIRNETTKQFPLKQISSEFKLSKRSS